MSHQSTNDYYSKYLKYKQKYLKLHKEIQENQLVGGATMENPFFTYKNKKYSNKSLNPKNTIVDSVCDILKECFGVNLSIRLPPGNDILNNITISEYLMMKLEELLGNESIAYNAIDMTLAEKSTIDNKNSPGSNRRLITIELGLLIIMLQIFTNYFPDLNNVKTGFVESIKKLFGLSKNTNNEFNDNLNFIINLLNLFNDYNKKYRMIKFLLNPYEITGNNTAQFSLIKLSDILSLKNILRLNLYSLDTKITLIKKPTNTKSMQSYNILSNAVNYILNTNTDIPNTLQQVTYINIVQPVAQPVVQPVVQPVAQPVAQPVVQQSNYVPRPLTFLPSNLKSLNTESNA